MQSRSTESTCTSQKQRNNTQLQFRESSGPRLLLSCSALPSQWASRLIQEQILTNTVIKTVILQTLSALGIKMNSVVHHSNCGTGHINPSSLSRSDHSASLCECVPTYAVMYTVTASLACQCLILVGKQKHRVGCKKKGKETPKIINTTRGQIESPNLQMCDKA